MPFRRLCADFGAEVTMSEMSFARMLLKGDVVEKARLRKADNEHCFGRPANTQNFHLSCWLHQNSLCVIFTISKCRGAGERHIAQYSDTCIQSQYSRERLDWVLCADCTTLFVGTYHASLRAGFQLATNNINEGIRAGKLAAEAGAKAIHLLREHASDSNRDRLAAASFELWYSKVSGAQ